METTAHDFLQDLALLFSVALLIAFLFRNVWAPAILGYLVTGIIIGPHAFGLLHHEQVEPLAEIGLILLLFVVGLELSPKSLAQMGSGLAVASLLQIGGTVALTFLLLFLVTDVRLLPAVLIGVVVSLSSTAIVLKQLSDQNATATLVGRITTGILLVQDVFVIVLMLFLPLLAVGGEAGGIGEHLFPFLAGVAGMAVAIYAMRKLLPFILEYVVRPGGREFIALFAVVMALGGAWAASAVGWSMPLGACIAGLLLADADERHQIAAEILPYRDIFNALFFISLGMLVNINVVLDNVLLLGLAVVMTLIIKTGLTYSAVRAAKWPFRPAMQVGVGLCTVSEFGYILVRDASDRGLMATETVDMVVTYIIGTMLLGAILLPVSGPFTSWLWKRTAKGEHAPAQSDEQTVAHGLSSHVIVVGYGLNGRNLSRVLAATRIPFCVIEMNPRLIQSARQNDVEVVVGDAARGFILDHAGLMSARALVVAINDPPATRRIVARARSLRPNIFILARTRFVTDIDDLYQAGASRVIPEEFETSIEIAAHVLKEVDVPDNVIEAQLAAVRAGGYGILRGRPTDRATAAELMSVFQLTATRTHYVGEGAAAAERTIAELDVRRRTGVSILAVVRGNAPVTNPPPHFRVRVGDVLVLVGSHAQLESARDLLQNGPAMDDDLPLAQHEQSAVIEPKQESS